MTTRRPRAGLLSLLAVMLLAGLLPTRSAALDHSPRWIGPNKVGYNLPGEGSGNMYVDEIEPGGFAYNRDGNYLYETAFSALWRQTLKFYNWGDQPDKFTLQGYGEEYWREGWFDGWKDGYATWAMDKPHAAGVFLREINWGLGQDCLVTFESRNAGNWTRYIGVDIDTYYKTHQLYRYFNMTDAILPGITSTTKRYVILIHGWNGTKDEDAYANEYFSPLFENISNFFQENTATSWKVLKYHMEADTATGNWVGNTQDPCEAAEATRLHGYHLAQLILEKCPDVEAVHLIAHSAGTWAARSAFQYLTSSNSLSRIKVQMTILDGFVPANSGLSTRTTNLGVSEINNVINYPCMQRKIFGMDNYFSNTDVEFFGGPLPGTQEYFNWGEFELTDDVNVSLYNNDRWKGHSKCILYYADSVLTPSLWISPEYTGGWPLSIAYTDIKGGGLVFNRQLEVRSAYGSPEPGIGAHLFNRGSILTNSVDEAVNPGGGTTQFVCTGWAMTGNEPWSGTSNTMTMSLTNDAVLTWTWATNYYVQVGSAGGTVEGGASGWYSPGSTVTVTGVPPAGEFFVRWTGDVPAGMETNNPLTFINDRPRAISAKCSMPVSLDISFPGYDRAEVLTNFPALVTFDEDIGGFRYGQFASTNGWDLRFTEAGQTNELAYEIESWDPSGASYVWVRIPAFTSNTQITATWGNRAKATQQAYTTNGAVWSAGYAGVWHLKEDAAGHGPKDLYRDSSTNENQGIDWVSATGKEGVIGRGQEFSGVDDSVEVTNTASLHPSQSMTLSAWVKLDAFPASWGSLIGQTLDSDFSYMLYARSNGTIRAHVMQTNSTWHGVTTTNPVPLNTWTHLAQVADGSQIHLYVNGVEDNQSPVAYDGTIKSVAGSLWMAFDSRGGPFMDGSLDEVRLSPGPRSPNWVWACYMNQRPDTYNDFTRYGLVDTGEGELGEWATKTRINITGYDRAERLDQFPLLVRLHEGIPGFRYSQTSFADARDLRFMDPSGHELPYEIESWNTDGTSHVWVRLRELSGTNNFIWAWMSNPLAGAPAYTTNGTVWAGFNGVWHMQAIDAPDATSNRNDCVCWGNKNATGMINGAQKLDGLSHYLSAESDPAFELTDGSIEFWMRPGGDIYSGAGSPGLIANRGAAETRYSIHVATNLTQLGLYNNTSYQTVPVALSTGAWYSVAFVDRGTSTDVFVDGTKQGTLGLGFGSATGLPLNLGCASPGVEMFPGILDEVRLSSARHSSNWIWACYMNQSSSSTCLQFTNTTHTLAFSVAGDAFGTITGAAEGSHEHGSTVSLTAAPRAGYRLEYWSGDVPAGMETDNPLDLVMDRSRRVTAHFIMDATLWARAMEITLPGSGSAETLTNFPALVVLGTNCPGFSYDQMASLTGADLRFTASDGVTELPYEIEEWNTNGSSFVWVQVPAIPQEGTFIQALWGLAGATNILPYTTNGVTWSADYRLVMHMRSDVDSSSNRLAGATNNMAFVPALIGAGADFNGTNATLSRSHSAVLQPSEAITINTWIKADGLGAEFLKYREIYRKDDGTLRQLLSFQDYGQTLSFGLNVDGNYKELDVGISPADFTNGWHLVTAVYDGASKRLYRDGVEIGREDVAGAISAQGTATAYIGSSRGTSEWYSGLMDEFSLSGAARSSSWIRYCYLNQGTNSSFLTYGAALTNRHTLEVRAANGYPSPGIGMHAVGDGASVTNMGPLTYEEGSTQYVCVGWAMTGNAPLSGMTSGFVMTSTNNATLTWQTRTNVLFTASVGDHGTLAGSSNGWYALGSVVTARVGSVQEHYQFAGWSGDVQGITNVTFMPLTMDRSRTVTANIRDAQHTLEIVDYGDGVPVPSSGTHTFSYGSVIACSWPPISFNQKTQYVSGGWAMEENEPHVGDGNEFVMTLATDGTLYWKPALMNVYLDLAVVGNGRLDVGSGWRRLGATVQLHASSLENAAFLRYEGDTDGCTLNGADITVPMTRARTIRAVFDNASAHELIFNPGLPVGAAVLSMEAFMAGSGHTFAGDPGGVLSAWPADVDGDGDMDVLAAGGNAANTVAWAENVGGEATNWVLHTVADAFEGATSVSGADVDGDGDADAIVAAWSTGTIAWMENADGLGSAWVRHDVATDFPKASSASGVDMDADGDLDILGAAQDASGITWWENVGGQGASWTAHPVDTDFPGAFSALGVDLKGDGHMGILGASPATGRICWWTNATALGTSWTMKVIDDSFGGAAAVATGDVDEDGDVDILGAGCETNCIVWWEHPNGAGTNWTRHVIDASFAGAASVQAVDLDGDGDVDALGAAEIGNEIAWWENRGGDPVVWVKHAVDDAFSGATCVRTADMNGDGTLDVLGAGRDAYITWWETKNSGGSQRVFDTPQSISVYDGTPVSCVVTATLFTCGSTQYVYTGWTRTGSQPGTGSDTDIVFTNTADTVLTLQWSPTNYYFSAAAAENGAVTGNTSGWYAAGATVNVTGLPIAGFHFQEWAGDVPAGMEGENPLSMVMDRARSVTARFAPDRKMKIRFAGYDRQETLTNFPALVVLNEARPGFSYEDFVTASGDDLRFYDATATEELDYEIESWNTNGSSYVWVRVPRLSGSNDCIWATWGDPAKATQQAYTTNGAVWAAGYAGVWHMREDAAGTGTGGLYRDSTANGNHAFDGVATTGKSGVIGRGQGFNGVSDYAVASNRPSLNCTNAVTLSTWVRFDDFNGRWNALAGQTLGSDFSYVLYASSAGNIRAHVMQTSSTYKAIDTDPVPSNTWLFVTEVADGANLRLYVNGVEDSHSPVAYDGTIKRVAGPFCMADDTRGDGYLDGSLDEVRLSGTARSANWVWACYMNQKPIGDFIQYGEYQLSLDSGPYAGGNTITITNTGSLLGNGSDITNVLVGGVVATIVSQGMDWVTVTMPATGSAGVKDIVIQSASVGDTALAGAYTVNPAGVIRDQADWSRWQEVAGLPAPRQYLAAGVLNDALYAMGGHDSTVSAATNVYRYNGTSWTEVAGLPAARNNPAAGVLNGALYAMGGYGYDSGHYSTNVYRYNGTSWAEVAGLPAARGYLAAGVLDGALHAIGGWDGVACRANVYRYNGTSWTEVAGLPAGRQDLAAGVLDGALYAIGGYGPATNVYRYNGTSWTEVAGLPAGRQDLAAGVLDGGLYAIGGSDGSSCKANVYRYNGTSWTEVAGLPEARSGLAAAVLDGALYAIGGYNNGYKNNVYRYPYRYPASVVLPASGSTAGGYTVTISGDNLCNGTDVTNVTLCGVSVAGIVSQSATQIVVTAGSAACGLLGDVRVYSTSFGETVKADAFTYIGPGIKVLGVNGEVVTSGEAASVAKGTDFGHHATLTPTTNTLSVFNVGNSALTVTESTTSGSGASAFLIDGLPATLAAGAQQAFSVRFAPPQGGTYDAALVIANDATNYTVNLHGSVELISTDIGPYAGGNSVTITNITLGSGSDITNVLVGGVAATITGQGADWVTLTMPAAGSAGVKDIIIQSTSVGDTTLTGVYTVNPAGAIRDRDDLVDWSRWQEVAGLPSERWGLAAAVLDGALYAIGGSGSTGYATNVYRYNGTSWTEVAGLPSARRSLAAGVLNGALYAVGGYDGSGYTTNAYRYNGTSWTEVAGLPAKRCLLAAGVLDEALYAVGGYDGSSFRDNTYRYDGANWTPVASLPAERWGLAAGVLDGALYAVGGYGSTGSATNAYRYNGTDWTEVAGLPSARHALAAGVLDGALYAIGGIASSGLATTNVYRYDGTNWTEVAGLPSARRDLAVGVLNNRLYAIGGSDGSVRTNVYRYPYQYAYPGVYPAIGSTAGGYEVTISGINLCNGSDITNVTLCGVSAAYIVSQSATQVVVIAGASSSGLLGDVCVHSASFGTTVKPNAFSYCQLSSNSGPYAGGNTVTITNGLPLLGSGSDITNVLVGGVAATITGQGANWVRIMMPSTGSAGLKDIVIQSASLGDTALTGAYTVNPAGVSTDVLPASGSTIGGYTVTIIGDNLCNGADVTNVTLCGVSVAGIVSQSATQIVVTAGSGGVGPGSVRVCSVSFGETVKPDAFTYNPVLVVAGGPNGAVSPDGTVDVPYGGTTNIVAVAAPYYHIGQLLTNGSPDVAAERLTTYTSAWAGVTANGTVSVSFAEDLALQGTPVWWLATYGLTNGAATFDQAETNDLDGDRVSAHDEYVADTDPNNSNSYFRIEDIAWANASAVSFNCSTARVYRLNGTTSLTTGSWSLIFGPVPGDPSGTMTLIDTNTATLKFYKIGVSLP